MYLVDTCGWIEWLVQGKLADKFARFLREPHDLIVPTIIQFELYKWLCREKDENVALEIIGLTEQSKIVDFTSTIALVAADQAKEHKLAMADAIIYATAIQTNASLITCDSHFNKLPNVNYIAK